jgi:hypothetical protein
MPSFPLYYTNNLYISSCTISLTELIHMKQVFYRERMNGYYGVAAYILANFISSFPFLVVIALTSCTITYNMVKFRPGFIHYVFFTLNVYGCLSVIESIMMVVASLVPNFLMGIVTGAGIIVRTLRETYYMIHMC